MTGIGALTPLGIGVKESWDALLRGKSGIRRITAFDPSGLRTQIAGEVLDFRPEDFMDRRSAKRFDRSIAFAIAASRMALEDAGLRVTPDVGVIIGNSLGGVNTIEENASLMYSGHEKRISAFFIPGMISSMASSLVAIELGMKGPNFVINGACASGALAIGCGYRLVREGALRAMLVGGTEAGICRLMYCGYNSLRGTSTRNHEPERASRPFDRDRDGFVPAEGAGMLLLEGLSDALDRGATIYAELVGFGNSCDAYHFTAPDPEGDGARRCMEAALVDAGLEPSEVDYINAHGTSTPLNDLVETKAIKAVFGKHSYKLMVSSNKSMIGHTVGAAGAIEAIFSVLTLREGMVPPTINYENPDPECDLDYVPQRARKADVRVVLSNSFGFGGINASLVFKKFES